jgi:peptide/nickel transport system substrate-binding protein
MDKTLTRADFLRAAGTGIAGAALLGLAGCGEEEARGGGGAGVEQVVLGAFEEPPSLNPYGAEGDYAVALLMGSVLEPITLIQPDGNYKPVLAEGMPEIVSEDPFTVQFRLKEGLTWSDGRPLTSEDCRFTYDTIMDPDTEVANLAPFTKIESYETPDERTVRVVFREPEVLWHQAIFSQAVPILPKHIYEGEDFNAVTSEEIVGSGPYVLRGWNKGQNLTLEANENYWGEQPNIKKATFRFISDLNSLLTALQSGEVNYAETYPEQRGDIERIENFDGVTVVPETGLNIEYLGFQTDEVDARIRKAVAYGLNRQQIVDQVMGGVTTVLNSMILPDVQSDYYVPAWEKYAFDPDEARRLVEEAKADGASTEIQFVTTNNSQMRSTIQQVIQQQMKEVGIEIKLQQYPVDTMFVEVLPEGNFGMALKANTYSLEPDLLPELGEDELPPDGFNVWRYKSSEVTEILRQANTAVGDKEKRVELIKRAQRMLAEDVPVIPLFPNVVAVAYDENLEGVKFNPMTYASTWNLADWRFTGTS